MLKFLFNAECAEEQKINLKRFRNNKLLNVKGQHIKTLLKLNGLQGKCARRLNGARHKISRLSVAAATVAKKPGRNQCRRITRVLAQGRAVSGCCSRDLDQAKTLSKNLISSLTRTHSQNSIVCQDCTVHDILSLC